MLNTNSIFAYCLLIDQGSGESCYTTSSYRPCKLSKFYRSFI